MVLKVEKDVYDALKTLKFERKNPYALICYKSLNGEKFNAGELQSLNKLTYKEILHCLDYGFELKIPRISENQLLVNVNKILFEQTKKGYAKYGKTVQAADLTTEQWIQHAQEEAIDFIVYLECIKQSLKERLKNES